MTEQEQEQEQEQEIHQSQAVETSTVESAQRPSRKSKKSLS